MGRYQRCRSGIRGNPKILVPAIVLNDWTGSRRVQTDYEGVVEQTCTNLPYGDGETCSAEPTEELYAGLERDSAAGLDNAMYRSYASAFGRWTTPDPYNGSYDWTNPQSLNRYAYVNGRPIRFTDPRGLFPISCPSGLPTSGVDPVTGLSVLIAYACDDGLSAIAPGAIGAIGASGWLADLAAIAGPIGELAAIGYDIYSMFSGGKPKFKGNMKASRQGKNVPNKGSLLHRTTCKAFSWLTATASSTSSTVGVGVGGSFGVGLILGIAGDGGVQVVADRSGNLGVAFTAGGNPGYGVYGVGAIGGGQASVSSANSIYDLAGWSWDFGASGGGGPAVGGDVAVAMDGSNATLTGTVGWGAGGRGSAAAANNTWVPSALSTKCQ